LLITSSITALIILFALVLFPRNVVHNYFACLFA